MKIYILAGALALAALGGVVASRHSCGSCSTSTARAKSSVAATTAASTTDATPVAYHAAAEEPSIFTSYEQAFRQAREENKLIMIDVYTDWCGWCKRLDKEVYTDPEVQKQAKQYFTAVKLNAEATVPHSWGGKTQPESAIAQAWGVKGFPTILFMTPDEQVIQVIPGYVPAKDFALALKFIGSGAYKTEKFEDWRKTQG